MIENPEKMTENPEKWPRIRKENEQSEKKMTLIPDRR